MISPEVPNPGTLTHCLATAWLRDCTLEEFFVHSVKEMRPKYSA
jgi:hypothetical protein